jgi:drug/metabolite transporter (DMT)-like permease
MDDSSVALLVQGIMCSGIAYYVQGIVIKERGPVFVTAFSPLCMIIVTLLGSIILSEVVTLGRYVCLSQD